MSKLDALIDNRLLQNIFVWLILFIILIGGIQSENRIQTALYVTLFLLPSIYITNYFILPFFQKSKTLFFILFLLSGTLFTLIPVYAISKAINQPLDLKMFLNLFGFILLAMIFGMTIRIARDSFKRRQEVKEAELKLLKGQLNPHFLFNTLNNLYGLSVIKSDKLPNLMLKLSDLLRYSLYETRESFVSLKKEISYLENYISLEKLRLEEQADISFSISGELNDKELAPMLLIVFVENAFKHLGPTKGEKSTVNIDIKTTENTLVFKCENSFDTYNNKEENMEKGKSGIGLVNVKKRLALIYPEAHSLKIKKTNDVFSVDLKLSI
ncbi:GHKL domain-containing protein [Tenacibaculum skagerrakense]|uniref:GHKL domain-containing protein n=1 Tax=Tenacibaculum skagerrakense TaxID=186571 RepID=A0A4R2NTV3_9FLAO|nr:histidine kinase [Tenacibaculum skagerrakense]TCP24981.1 GHKL domain-containing protein [Tenacibaculum skagerrakense]